MPYTEDYPETETKDESGDMLGESEDTESKETDGEGEEENTSLVPKSFLGGKELKPGAKFEVEVVHLYEDEAEIKVCGEEEEGEEEGDEMSQAESKMEEYASDNESP